MQIETSRLTLIPLTYDQLLLYYREDPMLDKSLGLNPAARVVEPELKEALAATIIPETAVAGSNRLFCTLWSAVLREEKRMVGDLCFIGPPDENGIIEIGYGTYPSERGKGYMTEAVGGLLDWAFLQEGVKSVWAGTLTNNPASWSILEKNGFSRYDIADDIIRWRKERRY